ncbi:hypothetical protein V5O48_015928 [Marasmius crinis-equi]|uniref:Uncharacterized protein n=1 Tax=Marasmius crinis-equi TaxID=585013 RepID=A0ABR3ET83_9AGAR
MSVPLSNTSSYYHDGQEFEISVVVVINGSPDFSINTVRCPASCREIELHQVILEGLRHQGITTDPKSTFFVCQGKRLTQRDLGVHLGLKGAFDKEDLPTTAICQPIDPYAWTYNDALSHSTSQAPIQFVILQEPSVICMVVGTDPGLHRFLSVDPPSSQVTLRSHLVQEALACGIIIPEDASMYLDLGGPLAARHSFRYPTPGGTHELLKSSCTYGEARMRPGQLQLQVVFAQEDHDRIRYLDFPPPATKYIKLNENGPVILLIGPEACVPSFLDLKDATLIAAPSRALRSLDDSRTRIIILDPTRIIVENCRFKTGVSRVMSLVTGERGSGKTFFATFVLLLFDIRLEDKAKGIWKAGGLLGDTEIAKSIRSGDTKINPNSYLCLHLSLRGELMTNRKSPEDFRKLILRQLNVFCLNYASYVPRLGGLVNQSEKSLSARLDAILETCQQESRAVVFLGDDLDWPHQVYVRETLPRHEPQENAGNRTSSTETLRESCRELISVCRSVEKGLAKGGVSHAFVTATWPIILGSPNHTTGVIWHRHRVDTFSMPHLERILQDQSLKDALTMLNTAHPKWRNSLLEICGESYNPKFTAGFFGLLERVSFMKNKRDAPHRIAASFGGWKILHTREQLYLYSLLMEILEPIGEEDKGRDPYKDTKRLFLDKTEVEQLPARQPFLTSADLTTTAGLSRTVALILMESEGVLSMDRSISEGPGVSEASLKFSNSHLEADIGVLRAARATFMNKNKEIDPSLLPSQIEKHLQHSFHVDQELLFNEYAFQDYVLELLLSTKAAKDSFYVALKEIELRVQARDEPHKIKWGFLDIGVIPGQFNFKGVIHNFELKDIQLKYLFRGKFGRYPRSKSEILDFARWLMKKKPEHILEMPVRYYDEEQGKEVKLTVGEVVKGAQDQLEGYLVAMANGYEAYHEEKLPPCSPVCTDYRITPLEEQHSYTLVKGYVLVNVGSVRVLGKAGPEGKQMQAGTLEYKVANLPPVASYEKLREKRKKQAEYNSQFVPVELARYEKHNPRKRGAHGV